MSEKLLSKVLGPGAISTLFHPIYRTGITHYDPVILECLSRGPVSTNAANPAVLFEYAQLKGTEPLVDRACISAALETVARLRPSTKISVNVFAATLARDTDFVDWIGFKLEHLQLNPSNIVFEIVEHGQAADAEAFLASLRNLRALGSTIALDDVGLAHSNFQRILECNAEYLKIDQCIVRNCHLDPRRQALLKSLAGLAKDLGTELIAEGVETIEEIDAVRAQSVELFQGFLFTKPVPPSQISDLLSATFEMPHPRPWCADQMQKRPAGEETAKVQCQSAGKTSVKKARA